MDIKAKAEPKPDTHRCPPSQATFVRITFPLTKVFLHFLPKKKLDFITLKCNKKLNYQGIDSVRKLMHKHYTSYAIVGSPVGGRHWHILAHRYSKRTLKVRKGVHLNIDVVGKTSVSRANSRPREDPHLCDAGLYAQLRQQTEMVKPSVVSAPLNKSEQLSNVLMYMMGNIMENTHYDQFEHFHVRL